MKLTNIQLNSVVPFIILIRVHSNIKDHIKYIQRFILNIKSLRKTKNYNVFKELYLLKFEDIAKLELGKFIYIIY